MSLIAWGTELEDLYLNAHVSYSRFKGPDINNEKQATYLGSDVYMKLGANNHEIFTLRSVSPAYSLFVLAPNLANVVFRHGAKYERGTSKDIKLYAEWSVKAHERGIELADIYGLNAIFINAYLYLNENLRVLEGTIYEDNNRMSFLRLLPTFLL